MADIETLLSSSTAEQLLSLRLLTLAGAGAGGRFSVSHRGPNPTIQARPKPEMHSCKVCGKAFPSHHALGGHKSSHRRPVGPGDLRVVASSLTRAGGSGDGKHQCSVCLRRFGSGQALGGHKRLHYWECPLEVLGPLEFNAVKRDFDLNLPPPLDETEEVQSVLTGKRIRLSE